MKLTLEGEIPEIIGALDALINRGLQPKVLQDQMRHYADMAAASAAKADIAARNAEMAAEAISKAVTSDQ